MTGKGLALWSECQFRLVWHIWDWWTLWFHDGMAFSGDWGRTRIKQHLNFCNEVSSYMYHPVQRLDILFGPVRQTSAYLFGHVARSSRSQSMAGPR